MTHSSGWITMKKGTFRYIDKDKILPWCKDRMKEGYESVSYELLIKLIDDGFFDWQQGSE